MSLPDLYEASVVELQDGLDAGLFTSVDLVKAYFARIEEVNINGPELRAVIENNPSAIAQAAVLDEERTTSGRRSLLHGIPVLLKDNIATIASEGMETTAGSYSLLGSVVPDDAGVVKRLRDAGAIMLGKANLSEFANFRSAGEGRIPSGWSGRGGQCRGAYFKNANPCGSSSGSGVAASIGLSAVTLGTETDGSIICPSSRNNIVGIKPTVGLTSRSGVIPISEHQDSVGPMTRSVADTAAVLSVIAGPDPKDKITLNQPSPIPDYTKALKADYLKGKRIGVPRHEFLEGKIDPVVLEAFEKALVTIKGLGATVVDPADFPSATDIAKGVKATETIVLNGDFKVELPAYFQSLVKNPSGVRSLADLIAYNDAHPELEKPAGMENQDRIKAADECNGRNDVFQKALEFNIDAAATRGIDATLKEHNLDAFVLPAQGMTTRPAAVAGYPIITVPLGFYPDDQAPIEDEAGHESYFPGPGAPFGLTFFSTAWSEFDLIGMAFAYEQATKTRLSRKAIDEAIPKTQLGSI